MATIAESKITRRPKRPPTAENEGYFPDDNSAVDVTGWLTANQAVDMLGCSRATMDRWSREGRVRPAKARRDPDSVREIMVYDPQELARLPRRYRNMVPDVGELAARVYEFLDDGRTDREIVILTRQTPQKIAEFREAWLDGGGAALVISGPARKEISSIVGAFGSVPELIERLRAKLPANTAAPASVEIDASEREGA